ncbi:MAG: hypothetical protein JW982_07245 [Spirochaetes bacterium]|nr:hypothetical protein [Spirochaetota bacterium]
MDIPNIEKRIKRKIKARRHSFYAVFPYEFQREILDEFKDYDVEIISVEKGGIEFLSSIQECMNMNLSSAALTRILLRVSTFRAILFSELKRSVSEIEWELYLDSTVPLSFKISCHASRLYHTDRIENEVRKGIEKRFSEVCSRKIEFPTEENNQTVFIRINENRVTVSLDSTGLPLYMRNIKTEISEAPLRENLAYLLLKKAGIDSYDTIVDPMSGTGTFSIESYLYKNHIFPGKYRNFAFEYWPVFSRPAFEFMKKSHAEAKADFLIYASDISEKNTESINRNFRKAEMDFIAEKKDFFSIKNNFPGRKVLLVLNPPYGKRLENRSGIPDFYKKIAVKIKEDFTSAGYIILCPEFVPCEQCGFDFDEIFVFSHGGIKINTIIKRQV